MRVLPFLAASGTYAWFRHDTRQRNHKHAGRLGRDVLAGVALGLPMAAMAAGFRRWVAPRYRLPTPADQALQTTYYFAVNAPAEELFWRGTVQALAIDALARAPGLSRVARPLGWALATAAFGAYHRLGHWSWRAIGGVTLAGGFFGLLHLTRPRRWSLLVPTIVHGFATAGFLSWGDVVLDIWRRRAHR